MDRKFRCIIYGLGSGRLVVEKCLNRKVEIVAYSDSYYDKELFNGKKFLKPNELKDFQFDYIIISIGEKKIYEEIYEKIKSFGINEEKIVKFFYIYSMEGYDEENIKYRENIINQFNHIDGLILGLSHGRDGIDIDGLKGKWCNLAIGSQDLYYNFNQLKHIRDDYPSKIEHLKYVIIDMYTYTYFNYDVSLTHGAINYYFHSGFGDDESHNYKFNKFFHKSVEDYITEIYCQINYCKKYSQLFNDFINMRFKLSYIRKNKLSLLDINEIKKYKYSNIERNIYKQTIKENIEIFEDIIKLLLDINKDVKIYLILIPQYIEKEKKIKEIEQKWKVEFYNIIDNIKTMYKVKVLDFKNCESISSNKDFYYNNGHLNFDGSKEFTKILDSYIQYD